MLLHCIIWWSIIKETQRSKDKLDLDQKLRPFGNSKCLIIEKKVRDYLGLEEGDTVELQTEYGEYGRYISMWNPEQQSKARDE